MDKVLERIHHIVYAVAGVTVVLIVGFFWGPRPQPVTHATTPSQALVVPPAGSIQREVQAALESEAMRASSVAQVPSYARPAVNVLQPVLKGFSASEIASVLSALGREKTQPVVHVVLAAPTPAPVITPPPEVSSDYAAWHHRDVYDATAEALAQTKVQVTVTQEPVPPSRTQSLLLSDQSAGLGYAIRRRGQFDLDLGVTERGTAVQPVAGIGWRVKGTQAGLFGGVTLARGKPRAVAGFAISF